MPRWGTHLLIANKIWERRKNIDKNGFLFGNILPDLQNGYLIKEVSKIINYEESHYEFLNHKKGYQNFYDTYLGKLDSSVMLGYFTHLIADYCFNKRFEEKWVVDNKMNFIGYKDKENQLVKKSKEKARKDKHLEFKIHEQYIYHSFHIDIPYFSEDLLLQSNELKNINIIQEDVKKAISFIKECKDNAKIQNIESFIFKKEEIENEIHNVIAISCEQLDKIM